MATKSITSCDNSLTKLQKYQLPNTFKKLGLFLFITAVITLVINKFSLENDTISIIAKYGLLGGMLIYSISKEKIEDELITKLRAQSYSAAFLIGVAYTLFQPLANFIVDSILDKDLGYENFGDFQILWLLLAVQIMFFETSKRKHQ